MDFKRLKYVLKFCGVEVSGIDSLNDLQNLNFIFQDENYQQLIMGKVKQLLITNHDHRECIEIKLFIHQDPGLRCLRLIPGGALEGGPKFFFSN